MDSHFRIDTFPRPLATSWLQEACGATLKGAGHELCGLTTDSRLVQAGDLFIAIRGHEHDGHRFVQRAIEAQATAILIDELAASGFSNADVDVYVVADTTEALGAIAHAWRQQFELPLLAITGSNGKTTTKEMVAAIWRQQGTPLVTWRNWNNAIGMPLTLLNLRENHDAAIIEMGMNHFGEIRYLTQVAAPQFRLINNIMPVHLEGVGSIDGVQRAKGELLEDVGAGDIFLENADDPRCVELGRELKCQKISFSSHNTSSDVHLLKVDNSGLEGMQGAIHIPGSEIPFQLHLSGRHNVQNLLAAVTCAVAMGLDSSTIVAGIETMRPAEARGEWLRLGGNRLIYNDTYNANPESTKVSLTAAYRTSKRVARAALGGMAELGLKTQEAHREVLDHALQVGYDKVYCFGEEYRDVVVSLQQPQIVYYASIEKLSAELQDELAENEMVVVKGSRSKRMERIVDQLNRHFGSEGEVYP